MILDYMNMPLDVFIGHLAAAERQYAYFTELHADNPGSRGLRHEYKAAQALALHLRKVQEERKDIPPNPEYDRRLT
jgi:hypothetical protein